MAEDQDLNRIILSDDDMKDAQETVFAPSKRTQSEKRIRRPKRTTPQQGPSQKADAAPEPRPPRQRRQDAPRSPGEKAPRFAANQPGSRPASPTKARNRQEGRKRRDMAAVKAEDPPKRRDLQKEKPIGAATAPPKATERQAKGPHLRASEVPAPYRQPARKARPAPRAPAKSSQTSQDAEADRSVGLIATHIAKSYKKRPVLRDVSVRVQQGEAVGLLGPNGAGKTTCFYIITGLITPDFGKITLDGTPITNLPMYRRSRLGIGYLPQEASIFRGLTVEQNIRSVLEIVESKREKREKRLEELMAEFSVTHLRKTPSVALSGGERRRVEIARALASSPNFILLDEPLAGIDPIAVGDIRDLVRHLKDRGIGVLITDHNVRETLDIVDRAYILHEGTVLMEGVPSEIVADESVRRVYLGDSFSL